ncbi:DNA-binding NarL/FixJ family response regulator [Methylobacterium sp. PvP062]|jgi:DNA-binding NarL/FixJ family response regulator|uniref:Two component transcriptional regulator, LuxR family n=2 Tax=Methylobacterium radiotolerans TaxID=31998 RepID=B1M5X7_METRJ|nr:MULTISPECIES: response regulator transcription factor [Methylobacterium]MCX7335032.1 response regulator transcription factor [Hyphomicrobiales bacterium]GAN52640.1 two component LuxR family transcriptional regulator [Methylobacterium sp. ME121]ACB26574.1 two component transcriptional regulator, LuxR family [Methylobacterium radiotolerans JCM 2831]KIU29173.1 LuxR family transcriptional regulator [Methylobacterium radiotolerans]KTS11310.1 LuxR family transcriptional regulator [Methylobacteriu
MASLGTRDALTLVERDTAESRGGFSGAHAGDSPVVVEQRDQSRGRSSRIVIIDRRQLVGRCLAASLSEADRQTSFEVFADIESWKRQKPFVPASVVVLCRPDGNLTETEWTEITRELAFLQGEAGAPPVAVISDGENLDQIVRIIKLGVKGYIPTTTSVDIALQALQLVQAGGVYIPAECLLPLLANIKVDEPVEAGDDDIFSPRQLCVARALRKGTPNKIIAYELNMCESTVKVHVRNIMKKLKAKNRTEVAYLTNKYFLREDSSLASVKAPAA